MPTNKKTSGFVRAGVEIKPRLIICTMALQKSGKSHLYLTGPAPVGVINIDDGVHRAIKDFQDSKEILIADYRRDFTELRANGDSAAATMKAAADQLERMREDYIQALADCRTVAVDGGAELYETVRLACFGKTEKVLGREYGPVNREMKLWMDLARASDANVVFTHRLKDEYINDKKTGGTTMDGWKKMPYECDIVLQQWKNPKENFPDRFHVTVLDCGVNAELEGEDLSGETATIPMLGSMVFGNDVTDWE